MDTVCWNMLYEYCRLCFAIYFMMTSCLAYSSTLKMEEICSPETSVDVSTEYTTLYKLQLPEPEILHNAGSDTSSQLCVHFLYFVRGWHI
jgi:hypothetical protein